MNEIATDGYRGILEGLSKECRLRSIPLAGTDADQEKGRSRLVDLCSNDYLGLAARESEFREAFMHSCPDAAFTSSASRLLSSAQRYHLMLEKALEHLYGKRALLFNSGYHANTGCISALAIPSTLFICDKLVHASIIDGLRIGNADFLRFPHNDLGKLRIMLEKNAGKYARIVVVTESIFSMDGDLAPLRGLTMLKEEFPNMILYVDEAHAFGVRGERGMGMAEELGLTDKIDIIIGTFGKAAASSGAFTLVHFLDSPPTGMLRLDPFHAPEYPADAAGKGTSSRHLAASEGGIRFALRRGSRIPDHTICHRRCRKGCGSCRQTEGGGLSRAPDKTSYRASGWRAAAHIAQRRYRLQFTDPLNRNHRQ